MGFYPDMGVEKIIAIETRRESVNVYDRTARGTQTRGQHIFTWGADVSGFEITYEALARIVAALAYNPSVIDAMGREWQEALRDATAPYIKAPASAGNGVHVISLEHDEASSQRGMREAAERVARSVLSRKEKEASHE